MSYATGRSSRPAEKLPPPVTVSPVNNTTSQAYAPGTPAVSHREAAPQRPAAPAVLLQDMAVEEDTELLPEPPQPPIIFPSSAAAVRVKEQQLAASGGASGNRRYGGDEDDDELYNLDGAADAAVAAEQQQGPGLLQRAVDVTSSAAQYAADLAAGAYAAAVGQGEGAQQTQMLKEDGGVGAAGTARIAPAGAVGQPGAVATLAPAERSVAAAATTTTTAAVLPAPSAAGKAALPVASTTMAAVKPPTTVSGAPRGCRGAACGSAVPSWRSTAATSSYCSFLPDPSLLQAAGRLITLWRSA